MTLKKSAGAGRSASFDKRKKGIDPEIFDKLRTTNF
jgi:hypothetical protein